MQYLKRNLALMGLITCLVVIVMYLPGNIFSETGGKKININTADTGELQTLPRIGPKVAQKIIEFRNKHGKFKKIEEIMKVKGIGEKIFQDIKDKITVT